ncbi:mediator complex subunit 13 C-terminal-domain-containing protein, partial [Thamnocephalis sphaerospora]
PPAAKAPTGLTSPLSLTELRTALIPTEFAPLLDSTTLQLECKYGTGGRITADGDKDEKQVDCAIAPDAAGSDSDSDSSTSTSSSGSSSDSEENERMSGISEHMKVDSSSISDDSDSEQDTNDTNTQAWKYIADASHIALLPDFISSFRPLVKEEDEDEEGALPAAPLESGDDQASVREFVRQAMFPVLPWDEQDDTRVGDDVDLGCAGGSSYAIVDTVRQVAESVFLQSGAGHATPLQRTHSTVRGQLSVKQLHDLYEAGQQPSKYGRYQVRKRTHRQGCVELFSDEPEIVVVQQGQRLALGIAAMRFWEALRLEPFAGKKALVPVILCPTGDAIDTAARQAVREIGAVYETCLLGTWRPANGHEVMSVALLPPMAGETSANRQLRSITKACDKLGAQLPVLAARDESTYVVYLVDPFPDHPNHMLDLCRCFQHTVNALRKRGLDPDRLVLQLLPLRLLANVSALAFTAYTRAFQRIGPMLEKGQTFGCDYKAESAGPGVAVYAPPFVLVDDPPRAIELALSPACDARGPQLHQVQNLHAAYALHENADWVVCIWVDDRGELVDGDMWQLAPDARNDATQLVDGVWRRSRALAERWSDDWHITVLRRGIMSADELTAWNGVCGDSPQITLACVAKYSALCIQLSDTTDARGIGATNSTGEGRHVTVQDVKPMAALSPETDLVMEMTVGEVYAVDVGHRLALVADSASKHATRSSALEHTCSARHLLPLASGSLVWLPRPEDVRGLLPAEHLLPVHLLRAPANVSTAAAMRTLLSRYQTLSYLHCNPDAEWAPIPVHLRILERLLRQLCSQSSLFVS